MTTRNILILGASYGSLLGIRLAMGGHNVRMVCLPHEAELINDKGAIVRMPIQGRQDLLEIDSRGLRGSVGADSPDRVDPAAFDLVALAMQEPQYRSAGVWRLMERVARSGRPCMSIMNMPPPPYLARIPGLDPTRYTDSYTEPAVWDLFEPRFTTLCSPDPQAFRPPDQPANVLQVRLPTNFKAARFGSDAQTALLRELAADIESSRYESREGPVALPVKLKVHDSIFVPLAKWAMLLAGNYRCVQSASVRSIRETVHADLSESRAMYEWVARLCIGLGADAADLVPFDRYARAALSLESPSSAARALAAGAQHIERVDRLVQSIAVHRGLRSQQLDDVVAVVDSWLVRNRARARSAAAAMR